MNLFLVAATLLLAQDPSVPLPAGSPLRQKPALSEQATLDEMSNGDYGGYHTWPEIRTKIAGWKTAHPDLVHQTSLGKTFEGRDIPLLRLSDDADVSEREPEVLLMAGIHPREQQPQVCLLRFVDELLAGYGKDERLTKLIKDRQIWIIPVLNVDGKIYDMKNGNGTDKGADWRKNRRPNPDGTVGVDLNRNFAVRWGGNRAYNPGWKGGTDTPGGNIYEGPAPLSEPESQALTGFITSRPRLRAFVDIHSPLRTIFFPPYLIRPEWDRYAKIAKAMQGLQKDPYPITDAKPDDEPPAQARGGDTGLTYSWSYYTRGVYGFNFEIGLPSRYPPVAQLSAEYERNFREPFLYFLEAVADLPPATTGSAACVGGAFAGRPAPGAVVSWMPTLAGAPCDYAVLVSQSPRVVVSSEYRRVPIKTGFTLAIAKNAVPGAAIPLTLYLWDKNRAVSVVPLTLVVEDTGR